MPLKPSEKEDEYRVREEFKRKKSNEEKTQIIMPVEVKEKLKELHYMHCPKCGMNLIEIDYKGLAIDKCSSCDGVWLDAGELEAVSNLEIEELIRIIGM